MSCASRLPDLFKYISCHLNSYSIKDSSDLENDKDSDKIRGFREHGNRSLYFWGTGDIVKLFSVNKQSAVD